MLYAPQLTAFIGLVLTVDFLLFCMITRQRKQSRDAVVAEPMVGALLPHFGGACAMLALLLSSGFVMLDRRMAPVRRAAQARCGCGGCPTE